MATKFKCRICPVCDGRGCIGQLPGMGGVKESSNFIKNVNAWKLEYSSFTEETKKIVDSLKIAEKVGIAPVTGAVQNIGFENEEDFYLPYFTHALEKNYFITIGDGAPDEKLKLGLEACKKLNQKGYFFLKPYPNENLFRRIELVKDYALGIGMDIDAYNIVTMRNQVHLEKKTENDVKELKKALGNIPLMLKGIFTREDIELCKNAKPEIIVISNHGGRVETAEGSTCDFLKNHIQELKDCCKEIWVDGGLRTETDVRTALFLGANKVLLGRQAIKETLEKLR